MKEAPSSTQAIALNEKWYLLVKKQPFIFGIIFNLGIVLFLVAFVLSILNTLGHETDTDTDGYASIIEGVIFLLIFLWLFYFLYRPLFNRKQYEVTADGDRLIVNRNGKEVFNVLGQQFSFASFTERPFLGWDSLKIDYVDEYERTRFFYIPLKFIPQDECIALHRFVFNFSNKYATNRKATAETDWGKFYPKITILTVFVLAIYFAQFFLSDYEAESNFTPIKIIALIMVVFFVIGSVMYFKQRSKKK